MKKAHLRRKSTLNLIYICSFFEAPCCCPAALLKLGNTLTLKAFLRQVCSTVLHPRLKTNTNDITIKRQHIPVLKPRWLNTLPVTAASSASCITLYWADVTHWMVTLGKQHGSKLNQTPGDESCCFSGTVASPCYIDTWPPHTVNMLHPAVNPNRRSGMLQKAQNTKRKTCNFNDCSSASNCTFRLGILVELNFTQPQWQAVVTITYIQNKIYQLRNDFIFIFQILEKNMYSKHFHQPPTKQSNTVMEAYVQPISQFHPQ